jgi:disulfide bond formation protein DsbB
MFAPMLSFAARRWLTLALAVSAAMLAVAHAFQTFGGLAPCHLCLQQRTVYWVAIGVSLAGLALSPTSVGRQARPWICGLLGLVFLAGAAIAVRHAGAEWHWWSAPETCSGLGAGSAADLQKLLQGAKLPPPRCDVAAWRMLGLSMAGWNALISVGLAGLSALAARASRTR